MGRPKIEPGQVTTTTRLLQAAELEFGEHGFAGAKLSDIAERAGVRRSSLLYHYGSKEALYSTLVKSVLAQIGFALQEGFARSSEYDEQLEGIVDAFTRFLDARPAAARLVLRELMDDRGPGHAILLEVGVPMLRTVELFIRERGEGRISEDLPIRGALLQLVSGAFVRASSGQLTSHLWGEGDPHLDLAHHLFNRRSR